MFYTLLLAAAAASAPAATPVVTGQTVTVSRGAESDVVGDSTRIICRSVAETGSRLGRQRICRTAAEWAAMRQDVRQTTDRVQATGLQR